MPSDKLMERINAAMKTGNDSFSGEGTGEAGTTETSASAETSAEGTTENQNQTSSTTSTEGTQTNASGAAATSTEVSEEDEFEFDEEKEGEQGQGAAKETDPKGTEGTAGAGDKGTVAPPAGDLVDEDSTDWSKLLPKEVEATFLKTARGKQMLRAFKANRDLAKAPEEGGLGRIPSTQEIVRYAGDALTLESMEYDFNSGVPEGAQGWTQHWFAANKDGKPTPGQLAVVRSLPKVLRETNPEAYTTIGKEIARDLVQELLSNAESASSEDDRKYFARFAASLAEYVFEDQLDISKFTGEAPAQVTKSPREQQLEAELAARTQREQEARRRSVETRRSTLTQQFRTERDTKLNSLIDQALRPVKERLSGTMFYAPTVDNFRNQVLQTVARHPEWPRVQRLYSDALSKGSPEAAAAALGAFTQLAMPVIKTLRPKYISDATNIVVQAAKAQSGTAAQPPVGSGGGAGAPPSNPPGGSSGKPPRLANESQSDYLARISRMAAEQVVR